MKKLYILAPNDRFNYGDLLFPHILTAYFENVVDEIVYCSTSKADLRYKGGHKVSSFRVLYEASSQDDNYLIVAGGEALCCSWNVILFIRKRYELLFRLLWKHFKVRKWENERRWDFINKVFRRAIGAKTFFPFTIGKNELPHFKGVFYNSLGGGGLAKEMFILEKPEVKDILKSVDYIAVRDADSAHCLESIGIIARVAADSAILMSEVFPRHLLDTKVSLEVRAMVEKKYIFVQGSKYDIKKSVQDIALQVKRLSEEYSFEICLCPIGMALGHCDDAGLAMLSRELLANGVSSTFIQNPSIYDIMWLIANAELYVGTSLHGVITAMSYGTPYCGYRVEKVKRYIETWGDKACFATTANDIYCSSQHVLTCPADAADRQKETVLQSFEKIKSFFVGGAKVDV